MEFLRGLLRSMQGILGNSRENLVSKLYRNLMKLYYVSLWKKPYSELFSIAALSHSNRCDQNLTSRPVKLLHALQPDDEEELGDNVQDNPAHPSLRS